MSDIVHVLQSQANDIKLDAEGKSTFSIRAVARLADIQHSSLRRALSSGALEPTKTATSLTSKGSRGGAQTSDKSAAPQPTKLAEKLIQKGFKPAALKQWCKQGIPDIAAYIILCYYAYDAGRYCTQQARLMVESLGAVGLRAVAQRALGYAEHASLALPQSPLMAEISALQHKGKAIAAEIQIHEKAVIHHQQVIEQLQQELDDTELKIADAHLELYDPIRKKLECYENKRLEIISKNTSRSFSPIQAHNS